MAPQELQVIGFLLSNTGLGEAARNITRSMMCTHINVRCVNIFDHDRSTDMEFLDLCGHYIPNIRNFIVAPLTSIDSICESIGKKPFPLINILYPFWELSKIPKDKRAFIESFDFIYAPSSFIAETFSTFLNKEIQVLPLPVVMPVAYQENHRNDGILKIFGLMDLDSWEARKNPRAILEAFLLAFPFGSNDKVELLLKIRGGDKSELRHLLADSSKKDSRIKIIDSVVNKEQVNSLLSECNVYISLHRSEGFGFGPAEAMALGKIVIATDYGGTKDFVDSKTGFPIQFNLIPVGPQDYHYPENQVWAEPDIEDAAHVLQYIYLNYDAACKVAENGRERLAQTHSIEAVSKLIKKFSASW